MKLFGCRLYTWPIILSVYKAVVTNVGIITSSKYIDKIIVGTEMDLVVYAKL